MSAPIPASRAPETLQRLILDSCGHSQLALYTSSLCGVREVRERRGLSFELCLHAIELCHVPEFELHGFLPGVTHGQQREAILGHVITTMKTFIGWTIIGTLLKQV